MTDTLTLLDHVHVTEREADGSWEDCTWMSGLEWYRLCYDVNVPATHAEGQALRAASGEPPTGGSNLGDLAKGIKARYGKTIPGRISGYKALRAALKPGYAAVIQGSMKAFGPTHRLSKWQVGFDGAHAIHLICLPDGVLKWCDALAPTKAAVPVTVTWTEVKSFVDAFNGLHVVQKMRQPEVPMQNFTYIPDDKGRLITGTLKPKADGGSCLNLKTGELVKYDPTWVRKCVKARLDDPIVPGKPDTDEWTLGFVSAHRNAAFFLDRNVTFVQDAPIVLDDGYTKATQDAAVAAASATANKAGWNEAIKAVATSLRNILPGEKT